MKKCLVSTLVISLLLLLFVFPVMAEEQQISYGKEKVTMTLVDNLDEVTIGNATFGSFEGKGGSIVITTSDIADNYDIKLTQSLTNADAYKGKTYIALDVLNNSDGDIYFCAMPHVDGSPNLFLRPNDTTKTVLVDSTGEMTEAVWTEEASLSGRYGFLIPEGFEGYLFIPFTSFCEHNKWDTSYITEAKPLEHLGMHTAYDTASYIEFFVNDLYTVAELPEYKAAEEGTPTPEPTGKATAETTATSEQTPSSDATQKATSKVTANTTPKTTGGASAGTTEDENSNTIMYIIIGCVAAAVVAAVVIVLIIKKKKKNS